MNKKMITTIVIVGAVSVGLSTNLLLQNKNDNVKAQLLLKQNKKLSLRRNKVHKKQLKNQKT